MTSAVQTVWTEFLLTAICSVLLFPSVRTALFYVPMPDKLFRIIFPLRALVEKKVLRKSDTVKAYSDIRVNGGVNAVGVVWVALLWIGIIALGILTLTGKVDGAFASSFGVALFWVVVVTGLPVFVGLFLGDRKMRTRTYVKEADPEEFHEKERQFARLVSDGIAEDQKTMMELGLRWHIEVLCTDRLEDEAFSNKGARLATLTGAPPTNPVYLSHAVATILDQNDQPVKLPFRRQNTFDLAYTANNYVTFLKPEYSARRAIEFVHDVTNYLKAKKA